MSADPLFDRLARALAGRYTLVRELGQGGMATVYLGTDLKLGRQVAVRALPPTTRAFLGSGRFQREVLLAAQLSHPHIVPLFEADEADGILFYVMGYVEGESLKDRLARQGPLPLADALRIAAEVGDALQYAHEVGVLHRDVKPANILLSRAHAMVADFGIAKLMEQVKGGQSSLTGAGLTPGTAENMSPEQAAGRWRPTGRHLAVTALGAAGIVAAALGIRGLTRRPHPPPEMALVPAGRYPVGGAPWREASTVRLGSFYIDSTEVTVGAYRRDFGSTLGVAPLAGRPPQRWPAAGVFWVEAVAYCAWRQPGGRLPTEDEWEAAARGPEGLRYPWGDQWVRGFANADSQRDGFAPAGADSLGRSWVGAVDLIGNAWEWTATEAPGPKGQLGHIIKGGAFDSPPQNAVAAFRAAFPDRPPRLVHTGFRCAQSVGAARPLGAGGAGAGRAVAPALGGPPPPAEQTALAPRSPPDPGAYAHFLRGNYELAQRTPRAVGRAIQEYQTAARLDPGYTPALARVALGYALFLDWGWPYAGLAPDGVLGRGEAAVDAALQQDSASADAWMARGFLMTFRNPRTFVGVREALQRAVVLDERNAEVYHQYGMALLWLGQDSAAAEMYHQALAREAERPITLFNLGRVALRQNRYRDAQRWADSTLAFDPAADYGYVLRALAELRLGNHVDARVDAETAVRLHAGFRVPAEAVVALAALQAGESGGARAP